jgi:tRNA (adenine57-N1/adenine58-N1)-methyltransferase catalytic subunit
VSAAPPDDGGAERTLLRDREAIVLLDRKGRSYLRTLKQGGRMSVRGAPVPCDEVIGRPEGSTVALASGERLLVLRPTYAQLIPSLPRQAQPIYPKDVGPLLLWGDIAPGQLVVEVGTGPAALTLALLRAVGPTGRLVSYEVRDDFATIARDNVARFHGPSPNWTLRVADAFEGIVERDVDRMVVDLAEPWQLLDRAAAALRPGAVLTAFVPTALQVKSHVDALAAHARFGAVEAFETLLRFWHVGPRSLRPEHRMVAHTGFLVVARRLADATETPTESRSELTPPGPYSTEGSDAYPRIAGSTHDDEGGDPPEDLEDD